MARHPTLGLTAYFLRQELTRTRWIVFAGVLLLVSTVITQLFRMMAPSGTLNAWDSFFGLTASYHTNLFILGLFFVVAILDNMYGYEEQNIFLRISNKLQWYKSKVLVLLVQIAGATLLFYGIPALVSFAQFPGESGWSIQYQSFLQGLPSVPIFVESYAPFASLFAPGQALVLSVVMTVLGLTAAGLFNLLLYMWLGQTRLLVVAINVLYLALNYVEIHYGSFGWLKYGMIYDSMILAYYFYMPGQPDMVRTMWLLVLLIIGFFLVGRWSLRHWSVQ